LVKSVENCLHQKLSDLNFLSRLLQLPNENYCLQQMEHSDLDAMIHAYRFVKNQLSSQLEKYFLDNYELHVSDTNNAYDVQSMGERSLKNVCLHYLVNTHQEKYFKLAYSQFKKAGNMTDKMGALSALNHHDCRERQLALNEFYEYYRNEPLVVNKWLLLQASSHLESTLDTVQALLSHPAFNIKNPNNVYALMGGFSANLVCFHEAHGSGYEWIADQVLSLDRHNSVVAARMVKPLTHWQSVDQKRVVLMKQALKRISLSPQLSKDVLEIVSRSL
jgi:aminopeptidase N